MNTRMVCLATVSATVAGAVHAASETRVLPNIVVILTDDLGYGDISVTNPWSGFETPNLDALARSGILFRHAHSTAAVCAPSRYAILTGNYVFRGRNPGGVWTHATPSQILPGQMTLAGLLGKHGYRSAFLGKLHLGGQFDRRDGGGEPARLLREADLARPMFDGMIDHGFDYSLVLMAGIQRAPYAFFENDRLARWEAEKRGFRHFDTDEEARRHFAFRPLGDIRTEDQVDRSWNDNYHMDNFDIAQVGPILTYQSLRFIEEHVAKTPDRPFFLYLSSQACRHPWRPPVDLSPGDPNLYDQPGSYPVRGRTPTARTDMVHEIDVTTGVLIDRLKKLGVYDNTLVFFTSDNGAGHHITQDSFWDDPRYFNFKWGGFGGNRVDQERGRTGRVVNPQGITEDARPLKGQKGDVYEGGHRVPLIIGGGAASGLVDAARGHVSDRMVGLHDFFATLCDLIGIEKPEGQGIDSISFAALLTTGDETIGPRRDRLMAEVARVAVPYEQSWIRSRAQERGWEMEKNQAGFVVAVTGRNAPQDGNRISGMMESARQSRALYMEEPGKRWKLVITAHRDRPSDDIEAWELYEMFTDPVEADNRIDDPELQGVVRTMLSDYRELIRSDPRYR